MADQNFGTTASPAVVTAAANPDLEVDLKESQSHRSDTLSILIYTLLLIQTVVTVWMFKHRRVRYLHETGLAIIYGLIVGAIIRFAISGNDLTNSNYLRVYPRHWDDIKAMKSGPPDYLLLEVKAIPSVKARKQLLNRTLAYSLRGEVRDVQGLNEIDQKATFDPEIFLNVLLPPIIFHAGYSMKRRFFFRNIGSILALAFVGTTISTFVVAGFTYVVALCFPHLKSMFKFLDTLRFGAIISATDPVTVLAIFNDLNVDVNLYALVFGESILNDAVAIVMTRTIEDYEETAQAAGAGAAAVSGSIIILKSIGEFLGIFSASLAVGCLMGCATALLTKFTHIRQFPELESTLFVLMSYSTFLISEVLNLTGIVAVLFCGICQAHYTYNNLSDASRTITKEFFKLLNFMAENFIFCYIGVSMFTFPKHIFDPAFIIGSFLAIALGRALNVYSICTLLNLGRSTKISFNMQHMLFFSGLRGAIAFALAIRNTLSEARQMILTTTLLIVIFTVVFNGGLTMTLLTALGIPIGVKDDDEANAHSPLRSTRSYDSTGRSLPRGTSSGTESEADSSPANLEQQGSEHRQFGGPGTKPGKSWLARAWSGIDVRFFKPLLTHATPSLMETMPECCVPFARVFTSNEQLSKHPAMADMPTDRSGDVEESQENGGGGAIGGGENQAFRFNNATNGGTTDAGGNPAIQETGLDNKIGAANRSPSKMDPAAGSKSMGSHI